MAGFSRRFDASYRDAHAKVAANTIGRPFLVRSQTCDLVDDTGFFVRYAKLNGGMFVDCCVYVSLSPSASRNPPSQPTLASFFCAIAVALIGVWLGLSHDIDLSMWFLGDVIPKAVWAAGTITHHPELAELQDVDNGVGIVEYWGGKLAYFYCSRTQAHGHDVCTEVVGTQGKVMVNLVPRLNNVTVASSEGIGHEVQPEYWERFEDAFATEAKEFTSAILDHTPVPVRLELGLLSLKIGWALQEALLTGERVRFDERGNKLDGRRDAEARL